MTDRANRVYGDQEREKVNNENLSLKKNVKEKRLWKNWTV